MTKTRVRSVLDEARGWGWIVLVAAFWIMVAVAIVSGLVEEGKPDMQRCVENRVDEGMSSENAIHACE